MAPDKPGPGYPGRVSFEGPELLAEMKEPFVGLHPIGRLAAEFAPLHLDRIAKAEHLPLMVVTRYQPKERGRNPACSFRRFRRRQGGRFCLSPSPHWKQIHSTRRPAGFLDRSQRCFPSRRAEEGENHKASTPMKIGQQKATKKDRGLATLRERVHRLPRLLLTCLNSCEQQPVRPSL